MSDSEEDDVHFCLRCKGTFIGLETYVEHRKVKCKRDESQPLTSLDLQFTKTLNANANTSEEKAESSGGNDTPNRAPWILESLQSSSPSVKDESRLEDVLQPDLLGINRKDEMLDNFLPPHDNDPCLNAIDFFSILELQSSKNPIFNDIPSSSRSQSGMVTRSKSSAVIQAKKNRESFMSKSFTPDYEYEYQNEHSQYVVGKDVVITDNYNYRKDDSGASKERKSDLDSPKSKTREDERMLEDDGKATESSDQFLFHDQEVHSEVIISSEVKDQIESDSSSEESEEDDEDEEYETRRVSTGGKWKPDGNEWSNSYWSSTPPASHTGGKWKPTPPPQPPDVASNLGMSSSSSRHHEDIFGEPQMSLDLETPKSRVPPPSHTKGKWLPTTESPSTSKQVWCGPCNRRLSSLALYEKHCLSDLHRRRTRQENQLEEDLSMEHPRALGKREVKRTQTYLDSELWARSGKRLRQSKQSISSSTTSSSVDFSEDGQGSLLCSICRCRVWPHLVGKHLVSHYHARRARQAPELAGQLALRHMESIVRQAPFQCGICRFYCNHMQGFMQHWVSEEHAAKDRQVEGSYSCAFCRVEYVSNSEMFQHLLSDRHEDSVAIINGFVPIIIQKKTTLQCDVCERQFRHNVELRQHAKSSGHTQERNTASDKYQERESCSQCPFVSFSKASLQRHLAMVHKDSQGKFYCTCCELDFSSAAEAKAHRSTEEHQFTTLTKQNNAKELTKVCCHCYSAFTLVSELKNHLREEHPEKSYRCIKCGCQFTLKQALASHARSGCKGLPLLESSPPPTSLQPLQECPKCAFTSNSEAELLFHLALHSDPVDSGDPPRYQCPSCPKVFLKSSLKKHLPSHTGERPYTCGICKAGFSRKDVLENHILSVHNVKRAVGLTWEAVPERKKTEECEECGACFYDNNSSNRNSSRQIITAGPRRGEHLCKSAIKCWQLRRMDVLAIPDLTSAFVTADSDVNHHTSASNACSFSPDGVGIAGHHDSGLGRKGWAEANA